MLLMLKDERELASEAIRQDRLTNVLPLFSPISQGAAVSSPKQWCSISIASSWEAPNGSPDLGPLALPGGMAARC